MISELIGVFVLVAGALAYVSFKVGYQAAQEALEQIKLEED